MNKHFRFIKDEIPNAQEEDEVAAAAAAATPRDVEGGGLFDVAESEDVAARTAGYRDMKMLIEHNQRRVKTKKERDEEYKASLAAQNASTAEDHKPEAL